MISSQKPKIAVSNELKDCLDSLGKKNDTYENIIWQLIKTREGSND